MWLPLKEVRNNYYLILKDNVEIKKTLNVKVLQWFRKI